MLIPEAARGLLESDALGHLVTIDADGRPQVSCVWVGLDGDDVVFASLGERRKLDNIARDPRVALSVEGTVINAMGLREYLVVHGTARVEPGGGPQLLQRLARTYLGPEVKFPPMDDPPPGVVVHITAERLGGVGPWR
jgi:PPOX class probable F420-dependent enzyme